MGNRPKARESQLTFMSVYIASSADLVLEESGDRSSQNPIKIDDGVASYQGNPQFLFINTLK